MEMSDIDNLDNMLHQKQMRHQRSDFLYVTGAAPDRNGRMKAFLLGPYADMEEARNIIERKRLSSAEIVTSPSADLARTGQILKARRLHGNASMADVFSRVAHKNVGGRDSI
jgi:hypothetical protein